MTQEPASTYQEFKGYCIIFLQEAYKTMETQVTIVFLYNFECEFLESAYGGKSFLCPGRMGKEGKWIIRNL